MQHEYGLNRKLNSFLMKTKSRQSINHVNQGTDKEE